MSILQLVLCIMSLWLLAAELIFSEQWIFLAFKQIYFCFRRLSQNRQFDMHSVHGFVILYMMT